MLEYFWAFSREGIGGNTLFKLTDKEGGEKRLGKAQLGIGYGHVFLEKNQTEHLSVKNTFLLSQVTNRTLFIILFLVWVLQVIYFKHTHTLQVVSAFQVFFLVLNPPLLIL